MSKALQASLLAKRSDFNAAWLLAAQVFTCSLCLAQRNMANQALNNASLCMQAVKGLQAGMPLEGLITVLWTATNLAVNTKQLALALKVNVRFDRLIRPVITLACTRSFPTGLLKWCWTPTVLGRCSTATLSELGASC